MSPVTKAIRCRRGQAVVMVTLALFLMLGMLGLAVDLGFAYFSKKSAQAAVDAAAMAAASEAFRRGGPGGSYRCSDSLAFCVPLSDGGERQPLSCSAVDAASNLANGCQYAELNGFRSAGRQTVTVDSGAWDGATAVAPPTAPGVDVYYWVTFRASERIPQLFSAALGNTQATAAARATAAIIDAPVDASLILLNRENDVGPAGTGVDLSGSGNATIYGGAGIYLASAAYGGGRGDFAGDTDTGGGGGSVIVRAPFTHIRDTGAVNPVLDWASTEIGAPAWENGFGDTWQYKDPMRGKAQPVPPTLAQAPAHPLPSGQIDGPVTLQPGSYYAVDDKGKPTGAPIRVTGEVTFAAGPSGFGNYVFYGGLRFPSTHTVATFEQGRYVLAGARQQGSNASPILEFSNQVTLRDSTTLALGPGHDIQAGNAGEIFIFTNAKYPGLELPSDITAFSPELREDLKFGYVDLQTGNNEDTLIDLHGLNNIPKTAGYQAITDAAPELDKFRPVVFWQDRGNSYVSYTPNGYINCRSLDDPGTNCLDPYSENDPVKTGITGDSPQMMLQAGPFTNLSGTVYQPRGAWLDLQGGPNTENEVQLISGAVNVHGGGVVRLAPVTNPILQKVVALVE